MFSGAEIREFIGLPTKAAAEREGSAAADEEDSLGLPVRPSILLEVAPDLAEHICVFL